LTSQGRRRSGRRTGRWRRRNLYRLKPRPDAAPEAEPIENRSRFPPRSLSQRKRPLRSPNPEKPAAEALPRPLRLRGYDESSPGSGFNHSHLLGLREQGEESLQTRSEAFGFADKIGQILIPTEEVWSCATARRSTSRRLVYPGYVLVEMEMNDRAVARGEEHAAGDRVRRRRQFAGAAEPRTKSTRFYTARRLPPSGRAPR